MAGVSCFLEEDFKELLLATFSKINFKEELFLSKTGRNGVVHT
jgi:hypothetical protein